MQLVQATAADAPAIARLINAAYRPAGPTRGWTDENGLLGGTRIDAAAVAAKLDGGRFPTLRDAASSPVLACAHVAAEADGAWYVSLVAVDPARQAAGLGALLLAEIERQARTVRASALRISVIAQRDTLIAWYERRGFTRTGTLPFPFHDPSVGRPQRPDLSLVVLEKAVVPR